MPLQPLDLFSVRTLVEPSQSVLRQQPVIGSLLATFSTFYPVFIMPFLSAKIPFFSRIFAACGKVCAYFHRIWTSARLGKREEKAPMTKQNVTLTTRYHERLVLYTAQSQRGGQPTCRRIFLRINHPHGPTALKQAFASARGSTCAPIFVAATAGAAAVSWLRPLKEKSIGCLGKRSYCRIPIRPAYWNSCVEGKPCNSSLLEGCGPCATTCRNMVS